MTDRKILITGTNRGIGLEFVKQYLAHGDTVYAGCRNPTKAEELKLLKKEYPKQLTIFTINVSDQNTIKNAFLHISGLTDGLDVLINNAGIAVREKFGSLTEENMRMVFNSNTVGPMLVTQEFLPLLRYGRESKIVNISSVLGSIGSREKAFAYGYSESKSALNMFSKLLSFDLRESNISVIAMHPGWVKTEMGGEDAEVNPEDAVKGMRVVIDGVTMAESGKYYDWAGKELPW